MDFMELSTIVMKVSIVIFMAGNMMDVGLRLNPVEAIKGLKDSRFVIFTLVWSFILIPSLAYLITLVIPLEAPYATGMILLGMAPCAPFIPIFINKANGDLGYTAAFMLLTGVGTIIFMPFAVPAMLTGLSISAWAITKPLLVMILIPLIIGMVILKLSPSLAAKCIPIVKIMTKVFTVLTFIGLFIVYGKGMLNIGGTYVVLSHCILYAIIMTCAYWFGFGLQHSKKIVLSIGLTTRNLGAAVAPLFSLPSNTESAALAIIIGLPISIVFITLSVKLFGKNGSVSENNMATSVTK